MRFLLLFLLILASCNQSVLALHQQKVSALSLASTHVGSPDPRKPPMGEMVVAEWWISKAALDVEPKLEIDLVFKDFSTRKVSFPICSRVGYETVEVVGEEFKETGGLLSYKAEIVTKDGLVYADWEHQLYVALINAD